MKIAAFTALAALAISTPEHKIIEHSKLPKLDCSSPKYIQLTDAFGERADVDLCQISTMTVRDVTVGGGCRDKRIVVTVLEAGDQWWAVKETPTEIVRGVTESGLGGEE